MILHPTNRSRPRLDALLRIAATGTLLAGIACSATGPKTGNLAVTITAPAGMTPSVKVAGGNGYSKTISASTTLTSLAPGSYTVTAAPVSSKNPIVDAWNTAIVSGSPMTVTAGRRPDSASVVYTARAGSGGLWISNSGSAYTTVQYTAAQLAGTTSAAAATSITTGTTAQQGAAFDANGNLWLAMYGGTSVVEFSASQLTTGGTPTPAVTISANAGANEGALESPSGLAFDASGDLWVANNAQASIVEFTPSQLAASGSPAPAVIITGAVVSGELSVFAPVGVAFDASGDLWVANRNPSYPCFIVRSNLVEFTPSQLAASGSPAPAVMLIPPFGVMSGPFMLAFDASGRLWVTNSENSTSSVLAFSPSQLMASGNPTPAITLTANAGSLDGPTGLAFDASGDLWIANMLNNSVVEFTSAQIAVSGDPAPTTVISGSSLNAPFGIAFDPHAADLPIRP
jgi:sugar lactone lactonase YvrE